MTRKQPRPYAGAAVAPTLTSVSDPNCCDSDGAAGGAGGTGAGTDYLTEEETSAILERTTAIAIELGHDAAKIQRMVWR